MTQDTLPISCGYNHPQAASALGSPEATVSGFFLAEREHQDAVSFVVDGFNLYHSVRSAERNLGAGPLRWLDLHQLCMTLLASVFGPSATLEGIYYFSALARHLEARKPDVVRRHRTLLAALENSGVRVSLANFKRKDRQERLDRCRFQLEPFRRRWRVPVTCIRVSFRSHEEKETDVAIACKLLELLHLDACEAAVLVTGDTDVAPAIRTARSLFPGTKICVAFPFDRHNRELARHASSSFRISAQLYQRHQFPDAITLRSGKVISKPPTW